MSQQDIDTWRKYLDDHRAWVQMASTIDWASTSFTGMEFVMQAAPAKPVTQPVRMVRDQREMSTVITWSNGSRDTLLDIDLRVLA